MQNVQNAAEIQQRVINLVNTYRTQMCEKYLTRDLSKKEIEYFEKIGEKGITKAHIGLDAKKIEVYCFNEQLLGHFYAVVAGSNAEKDILLQLLPDFYDTTIYTSDEEVFLIEHFREMVNYIIQTPLNDWDEIEEEVCHDDSLKLNYLIPEEIQNLIETRVQIPSDAVSYNLFAGLGQFAIRFNGRNVLWSTDDALFDRWERVFFEVVEESYVGADFQLDTKNCYKRTNSWKRSYAWARVAMYANNVRALRVENGDYSFNYNVLMAYIPFSSYYMGGIEMVKKTHEAYNHLKQGGKMILLCPNSLLCGELSEESMFRAQLVKDHSIVEIIQLPPVFYGHVDCSIVIAEKGHKKRYSTFIDAQNVFQKKTLTSYKDRIYGTFDMAAWRNLLQKNGIDQETGLHTIVQLKTSTLNPNMLLPQICVLERPLENEKPLPLSKLCNFVGMEVKEIDYDLPTDTIWVRNHNLSHAFQGALDLSVLETVNCPNIPPHTDDYRFFKDSGEFIDAFGGQQTEIGRRVVDYRHCKFIDGTKDAVLYFKKLGYGVSVALIRAIDKPIAIDSGITVFIPKDGIDALSLAALLQMPVVNRQIEEYQKISPGLGLSKYMDDILVPIDKRIIHEETQRLLREEKVYKELTEKLLAKKTEYINEVRMRKHDMRPHMRQLNSAKNMMQYYVKNMDSISGVQELLNNQINRFGSALGYLSDLIEHLSDEDQFGKPELFSLDKFFLQLKTRHKAEGFKIEYEPDMSYHNEIQNRFTEGMDLIMAEDMELQASLDDLNTKTNIHHNKSVIDIPSVYVSQNDLQRAVNNILDNARKHGFTDPNRKDYEIRVSLAIDVDKNMFQVDFRNNGNPLPDGIDKLRYGLLGEKAGKTGGTGIGGNYVKKFVEHYGGDYDVHMEDGWVIIRIYLPIK